MVNRVTITTSLECFGKAELLPPAKQAVRKRSVFAKMTSYSFLYANIFHDNVTESSGANKKKPPGIMFTN